MTMTHKEALRAAREAVLERMASMSQFVTLSDMWDEQDTILIRTYIEARGLVLAPREATTEMRKAGEKYCGMANCVGDEIYIYDDMLAAAPDPFEEGE